jgi:hypothetical protein
MKHVKVENTLIKETKENGPVAKDIKQKLIPIYDTKRKFTVIENYTSNNNT